MFFIKRPLFAERAHVNAALRLHAHVRVVAAALEDLFYQYVQHLEDICETEHGEVFIDGTKLESKANKYTFVWKKIAEKLLAKTKEKAKAFLQDAQVEGNVTKQKVKAELEKLNEQITLENIVVKRGRGHHKPEIVRQRDL
ncbi:MAG: hypothetical protein R3Y06_06980, partial [Faecalibacterium sp.]